MKKILFIGFVLLLLLLTGCSYRKTAEIKNDYYINKTVAVRGIVEKSIKIGELSGFTLTDDTGSIPISSKELPEEGKKVIVKGTMEHKPLLGYIIIAENIW